MNFGTPVPLIVGVILIVGAIALFFLDRIKPGYRRDSDNVYAFLGLLAGVILLAHLGMEFTLSLQQMIMVGMLVALMLENIQNRIPHSGPARQPRERGGYRDDDYRPRRSQRSSRMRSEAQLEFDDEMPSRSRRRIRGENERRSRQDEYAYEDDYNDESSYRRSRRRPAAYDDYEQGSRSYSPDSYAQDSYGYDQNYSASPSYAPPETSTERPRRRRPLQLTGELEDKDYTPDDYSSAVKAMRNRRRKNTGTDDTSTDDYSASDYSGDSSTSDAYGQNGNGDYADYKPLDLPKYPGPSSGPGGPESDDGSY